MLVYNCKEIKSKFPLFLNIGNANPVAIFGGYINFAAIDTEGRIIFIYDSISKLKKELIPSYNLPNGEKAVSVACCETIYFILSSSGKLFQFKFYNMKKFKIEPVKELREIKIVQISGTYCHALALTEDGKVFSYGVNDCGETGIDSKIGGSHGFLPISSLNNYKIKSINAGEGYSFFQMNNGQVLACGNNYNGQCLSEQFICNITTPTPIKTKIDGNINFFIARSFHNAFFVGFEPEMCPNKRIVDEIKICMFGDEKKTIISQLFINSNYKVGDFIDEKIDEYSLKIDINHYLIKLTLIDPPKNIKDLETAIKYYHRAPNFLFFIDIGNDLSVERLIGNVDNAIKICHDDFNYAIVAYSGVFSSEIHDEKNNKSQCKSIREKFKCELFEINADDPDEINRPFYNFVRMNKENKNIIKVGKEHRNPFLDININNINIGIFGDTNVEKTEFAFRIIFDDLYKHFNEDFKTNFTDIELTKLIEVNNERRYLSIIDSSLAEVIDDSYYLLVQGIIFVFSIDLISSPNYIDIIQKEYNKAMKSIKGEFIFEIGLKVDKNKKDIKIQQKDKTKIDNIEEQFKCPVFIFSTETGENIEDMIYYLTKKISKCNKQTKKVKQKKHKQQKKKIDGDNKHKFKRKPKE